ncbi:hypothetical protein [Kribbella sp. NPDC051620]
MRNLDQVSAACSLGDLTHFLIEDSLSRLGRVCRQWRQEVAERQL